MDRRRRSLPPTLFARPTASRRRSRLECATELATRRRRRRRRRGRPVAVSLRSPLLLSPRCSPPRYFNPTRGLSLTRDRPIKRVVKKRIITQPLLGSFCLVGEEGEGTRGGKEKVRGLRKGHYQSAKFNAFSNLINFYFLFHYPLRRHCVQWRVTITSLHLLYANDRCTPTRSFTTLDRSFYAE